MAEAETPPTVLAVVGSPRRDGNTAYAVSLATAELERRGVRCETVLLCEQPVNPCLSHDGCADLDECRLSDGTEALLEKAYAADGLILATPVYFADVSAQMKAFIDRTNRRYLHEQWLRPKVAGLVAIAAEFGAKEAVATLRRFLKIASSNAPPRMEVAMGTAEAIGAAESCEGLRADVLSMAARMADVLSAGSEDHG